MKTKQVFQVIGAQVAKLSGTSRLLFKYCALASTNRSIEGKVDGCELRKAEGMECLCGVRS
jgi:hypothetical protein